MALRPFGLRRLPLALALALASILSFTVGIAGASAHPASTGLAATRLNQCTTNGICYRTINSYDRYSAPLGLYYTANKTLTQKSLGDAMGSSNWQTCTPNWWSYFNGGSEVNAGFFFHDVGIINDGYWNQYQAVVILVASCGWKLS